MNFEIDKAVEQLSRTPAVLESLLDGLTQDWLRNNEGPETWSPYDVVGHLIHGEKTDWIPRAKIILSNRSDRTFTPYDRFAQQSADQSRPIHELLIEFKALREENLKVLYALRIDDLKLSKTGIHPELGTVNLKQLLSAWVVHDLGHIVQISRVIAKQFKSEVGPWTAYLRVLD